MDGELYTTTSMKIMAKVSVEGQSHPKMSGQVNQLQRGNSSVPFTYPTRGGGGGGGDLRACKRASQDSSDDICICTLYVHVLVHVFTL